MLEALLGKQALPASELAARAGITAQTASTHLAKLVEGGLLAITQRGRHRYYSLASAEVAYATEALAVLAPPKKVRTLRESLVTEHLRSARTCYDHLAGKLGVAITRALEDNHYLQLDEENHRYQVTEQGSSFFTRFGLDLFAVQKSHRAFAIPCLDWSERCYHLAGALGAVWLERLMLLGWIERKSSDRAVQLSASGEEGLNNLFGKLWHA
jgi:predicted transcriptional regulator